MSASRPPGCDGAVTMNRVGGVTRSRDGGCDGGCRRSAPRPHRGCCRPLSLGFDTAARHGPHTVVRHTRDTVDGLGLVAPSRWPCRGRSRDVGGGRHGASRWGVWRGHGLGASHLPRGVRWFAAAMVVGCVGDGCFGGPWDACERVRRRLWSSRRGCAVERRSRRWRAVVGDFDMPGRGACAPVGDVPTRHFSVDFRCDVRKHWVLRCSVEMTWDAGSVAEWLLEPRRRDRGQGRRRWDGLGQAAGRAVPVMIVHGQ